MCARACVPLFVRACVSLCVRARVCVRATVRACVRVTVRARARVCVSLSGTYIAFSLKVKLFSSWIFIFFNLPTAQSLENKDHESEVIPMKQQTQAIITS